MTITTGRPVELSDRYTIEAGRVLLNGTQALVRLLLTQRRLDQKRGLNTGMFVSGYPGSPLGGLDTEIARSARHLNPLGVVFSPGVNEELAATAVAGTQLLEVVPGRRVDGVTGFWYGKTPGLDRAADAIRHANISGTSHLGGAVALIGDDPTCKSSTIPGSSEALCRSLLMPLLAPSSVQEVIELGLHAVALSRAAGTWAGLKIVSDIADGSATVELGDETAAIPMPPAASRGKPPVLLAPTSLTAEHDLMTTRWRRVEAYGRAAGLNRVVFQPTRPAVVVVAAGGAYATLRRALQRLGIGDPELDALGVRLVQLRMPWPLSAHDVEALFSGVEEIMVVEDKLPFIETQLRELLYGRAAAPRIVGKRNRDGRDLLTSYGALDADAVAAALMSVLPPGRVPHAVSARRAEMSGLRPVVSANLPLLPSRTPFFCSGCPHNTSTRAPADQLVGAGIGCHALVALAPDSTRGTIIGAPQMGGEGAHWIGIAPFTDERHLAQNMGDGTFHHSGSLAIRAAVAAGVTMTFKLLYNDAVAMTGGQEAQGRLDVPTLTRWLALEGVRQVVITTPDPKDYRSVPLGNGTSVRHRDDFAEVEAELAAVDGVTAIIHDDRCATEERRMRKRNLLPVVTERVWINERVCEGCGDCGEKSSCLSVVPVETEFGRKTAIHQASCNSDLSCLKGDCPSFIMVDPGAAPPRRTPPELPVKLIDPVVQVDPSDYLLRMPGVGGTGVVTVSAIVQMAAMIDGRNAAGLDQTGLAQKGGAVISDVRIADQAIDSGARASAGSVDVLLGLDEFGAADAKTLLTCDPARTVAIVNTGAMATAAMVTDIAAGPAPTASFLQRIDAATRSASNLYFDAQALSDALFGDHMPANLLMLGAAYQRGLLPLHEQSIIQAIELNGSGVKNNLAAFRWGRAVALDADAVADALAGRATQPEPLEAGASPLVAAAGLPAELSDLLTTRVSDLIGYQSQAYARRYLDQVTRVNAAEQQALGREHTSITAAFARGLHKLMAYKDEYEVARLHLLRSQRQRLEHEFGAHATSAILLHPPILRSMGLKNKIRFGRTSRPALSLLKASRRVRGTALDPFGRAEVRRVERALVPEYEQAVTRAMAGLTDATAAAVEELAGLPDLVRGYEGIKLANVARYHERLAAQLQDVTNGTRVM